MIVCSCLAITDEHIEQALVEILGLPDAPLPTPGVVYRHLSKKMVCCSCSPLAVSTIYEKIDQLAEKGCVDVLRRAGHGRRFVLTEVGRELGRQRAAMLTASEPTPHDPR